VKELDLGRDPEVIVLAEAFTHVAPDSAWEGPPSASPGYRSLAEALASRDGSRFVPGSSNLDFRLHARYLGDEEVVASPYRGKPTAGKAPSAERRCVGTDGGSHLALPEELCPLWTGAGDNYGSDGGDTAYDRLFERVQDQGNGALFPLAGGHGIGLAGPDSVTFWPEPDRGGGLLVTWIMADGDEDMATLVAATASTPFVPVGEITLARGRLALFDSACPSRSAPAEGPLRIVLPPDRYYAVSRTTALEGSTEIALVRLEPRETWGPRPSARPPRAPAALRRRPSARDAQEGACVFANGNRWLARRAARTLRARRAARFRFSPRSGPARAR